jgi:hypothetical protein
MKLINEINPVHNSGSAPYGYTLKNKRLYTIESEQKVVKLIIQYRSDGVAYNRIAKILNDMGIPTKHNRKWGSWTVCKVYKKAVEMSTRVCVDVDATPA